MSADTDMWSPKEQYLKEMVSDTNKSEILQAELHTPTTPYNLLQEIELTDLNINSNTDTRKKIKARSLWENAPCLVLVVRRPGCWLCRQEAIKLATYRELITNKLGIDMIAVVHETVRNQVSDFNMDYWMGSIYLDESKGFYRALGNGELKWESPFAMLKPTVLMNYRRQKKETDCDGNMVGEGRILGGLLIMKPGDQGVAFDYHEKTFGDHAPLEHVLQACYQVSLKKNTNPDLKQQVEKEVEKLKNEGFKRVEVCSVDGLCEL
ncbi:13697_t:CDS:2 [Ambispora leptoticha]|uniref:Peroxiredoxin-like 2A n=1 Tax=Ambispora leptoticha TaxID=144679 RepID=A0A9N9BWP6_9GLOM|nr:13697_t:CDS:2 [Ambispora leptoticha]